jgi:NMD protein affecting ribosome stability and mRNA decay
MNTIICPKCKQQIEPDELVNGVCFDCMALIEIKRRQRERINSPRRFRNKTSEENK